MNRCRLETIRAYWSGRVAAYSAVNADELGTIQAKVWDELIAEQLPFSREQRPGWDKACLERLGCRDVLVRAALPPDIMNDYYRIRYTHIPMFLVRGIKQ